MQTAHQNADHTEESPRNSAQSTRGRPFRKGNPGRRRGSRNKATVVAERLLAGEAEAITRAAINGALDGNVPLLTTLLRLLISPPKERAEPISFRLPDLHTAAD